MRSRTLIFLFEATLAALAAGLIGACAGDGSAADASSVPVADAGADAGAALPSGAHEVFVVAHQDDDLLFMNPDIARAILDPEPTVTIYLTAGDAGHTDENYYRERERGVMAAYAALANVSDPHWSEQRLRVYGHDVLVRRLAEVDVSIVFLRLPDGNGNGAGFATGRGTRGGSLAKLWRGGIASLTTVDRTESYTHDELVDTLAELFQRLQATRINALDGTGAYGYDHSDHVHAALFTQEASPASATLRLYRGYNIRSEAVNLSVEELQAKWAAFSNYVMHDSAVCSPSGQCDAKILEGYAAYAGRQYLIGTAQGSVGLLANAAGLCLEILGDELVTATCSQVASQRFRVTMDGRIRTEGSGCLTGSSAQVSLAPCASGLEPDVQRWSLLSGGNLINVNGSCLRGGAAGARVALGLCDRSPHSQWGVRFGVETARMRGGGFASKKLLIADIDGDGQVDVCGREAAGIECARGSRAGTFSVPAMVTPAFGDAAGWNDSKHDGSIQAVDIDKDGHIDFCGLADGAVQCARGLEQGIFGVQAPISHGTDFAGAHPGSFAMGDVDADGFPDACARVGGDVQCALGDRSGRLSASTTWLSAKELSMPEAVGSRWALADVTGDGRADICRIGADGVVCATAHRHRHGFERPRRWLSAPVLQLESVAFGDVDGDGSADLCALSGANVMCATSTGSSFSALLVRVAGYPEDPSWASGHLALGDLDGDHRVDACRWTEAAIMCAAAPQL